jgi:hypothetical protein
MDFEEKEETGESLGEEFYDFKAKSNWKKLYQIVMGYST